MENTETMRMPMIGDVAPSFRSMTTKGKINFPDDYKGKWVVFFSHPADFTPVCTTEFIALSKRCEEFKEINTELLGLSIDSLRSRRKNKNGIAVQLSGFAVQNRPEYSQNAHYIFRRNSGYLCFLL